MKERIKHLPWSTIAYVALGLLMAWRSFDEHRSSQFFNWRSELWQDKGGYYIYLPGTFIYDWEADKMPDYLKEKEGWGFWIQYGANKIETKYTYGIALFELPVFLVVHSWISATGGITDGFSGWYHNIPTVTAWFFAMLGLFFWRKFLLFYFSHRLADLAIFTLFLGSHIYYYGVYEPGMSHIYSFALVGLLMWSVKMLFDHSNQKLKWTIIAGFALGLIVLIRPVNAVLGLVLFLDANSWKCIWERILFFLQPKRLLVLAGIAVLIFAPQLIYWHYLTGSFLYYSYGPEGFPYLLKPKILTFLFAPENGFFLYNLATIPAFGVVVYWAIKKQMNAWIILIPILFTVYLCGSWHIVSFGCSFSARPLVEYVPLLALPMGYFFQKIAELKWVKTGATAFLVLAVLLTQKLTYSYDYCYPGDTWEIRQWYYLLLNTKSYKAKEFAKEEQWLTPEKQFSGPFEIKPELRAIVNWRAVNVTVDLETTSQIPKDLQITTKVMNKDSSFGWYGRNLSDQLIPNSEQRFRERMWIPKFYPMDCKIEVGVWNRSLDSVRVKRIQLKAE